jgi:hypothetical protein
VTVEIEEELNPPIERNPTLQKVRPATLNPLRGHLHQLLLKDQKGKYKNKGILIDKKNDFQKQYGKF